MSQGAGSKRNKNKGLEQFCFDKPMPQTYHTAPMSGALPEYLDLTKVGHTPLLLAGSLSVSRMSRLCAAVTDASGEARIDLRIFKEGGLAVVSGKIQANLGLSCQRCFGPLRYPVNAAIHLAWTGGAQEAVQPLGSYEVLDSSSGRVKLVELVEDELLLTLPLAARHDTADECGVHRKMDAKPGSTAPPVTDRHPFEILKTLKRR